MAIKTVEIRVCDACDRQIPDPVDDYANQIPFSTVTHDGVNYEVSITIKRQNKEHPNTFDPCNLCEAHALDIIRDAIGD